MTVAIRRCHFCKRPYKEGELWGTWLVNFHQGCILNEQYRDEVQKQKTLLTKIGEPWRDWLAQKGGTDGR